MRHNPCPPCLCAFTLILSCSPFPSHHISSPQPQSSSPCSLSQPSSPTTGYPQSQLLHPIYTYSHNNARDSHIRTQALSNARGFPERRHEIGILIAVHYAGEDVVGVGGGADCEEDDEEEGGEVEEGRLLFVSRDKMGGGEGTDHGGRMCRRTVQCGVCGVERGEFGVWWPRCACEDRCPVFGGERLRFADRGLRSVRACMGIVIAWTRREL
jgi:hypothetical protein